MSRSSSRYRRVSQKVWGDDKFRQLSAPPPNGRYLWLYLLTGPYTTNIPGCIVATPAVLAASLGWEMNPTLPGISSLATSLATSLSTRIPTSFREAFAEVLDKGLAEADEAGLIWLPNGPEYNPPTSPNVVVSWRDTWETVPECFLKGKVWRALDSFTKGLGDAFGDAFRHGCHKPFDNQDQEQEQEQEVGAPLALFPDPEKPDQREGPSKQARIRDLWELQNDLRQQVIPGSRRLTLTKDAVAAVEKVLEAGYSDDDCKAVLESYAEESRKKPESRRWFNGETNWILKNFRRTLGFAGPAKSPPKPIATAADDDEPEEFTFYDTTGGSQP